jgi:hypothetical protein
MIIHGTEDMIVPLEHSLQLYAKLQNQHEPYWVEGAGHNDVAERREYYWNKYDAECAADEARSADSGGVDKKHMQNAHRRMQSDVFTKIQESERKYFEVIAAFAMKLAEQAPTYETPRSSTAQAASPNTSKDSIANESYQAYSQLYPPGCVPDDGFQDKPTQGANAAGDIEVTRFMASANSPQESGVGFESTSGQVPTEPKAADDRGAGASSTERLHLRGQMRDKKSSIRSVGDVSIMADEGGIEMADPPSTGPGELDLPRDGEES